MNKIKIALFDCPNCCQNNIEHKVFSDINDDLFYFEGFENDFICIIICNHCQYKRLIVCDSNTKIKTTLYPLIANKPLPDCMPEDLRKDFDEARLIVNYSVRCAVGLLRICGEKLCNFIADKYITDENIKKKIKEEQNTLQPKIDLLVKYREDYFSFIDEEYIKNLEVVKKAGNNSLHSREISDEYTIDDFDTLCTIITAICDTIATKEESYKRINALKQKNAVNK